MCCLLSDEYFQWQALSSTSLARGLGVAWSGAELWPSGRKQIPVKKKLIDTWNWSVYGGIQRDWQWHCLTEIPAAKQHTAIAPSRVINISLKSLKGIAADKKYFILPCNKALGCDEEVLQISLDSAQVTNFGNPILHKLCNVKVVLGGEKLNTKKLIACHLICSSW